MNFYDLQQLIEHKLKEYEEEGYLTRLDPLNVDIMKLIEPLRLENEKDEDFKERIREELRKSGMKD